MWLRRTYRWTLGLSDSLIMDLTYLSLLVLSLQDPAKHRLVSEYVMWLACKVYNKLWILCTKVCNSHCQKICTISCSFCLELTFSKQCYFREEFFYHVSLYCSKNKNISYFFNQHAYHGHDEYKNKFNPLSTLFSKKKTLKILEWNEFWENNIS